MDCYRADKTRILFSCPIPFSNAVRVAEKTIRIHQVKATLRRRCFRAKAYLFIGRLIQPDQRILSPYLCDE